MGAWLFVCLFSDPFSLIGFKDFFHCIAHLFGPPTSFSSWFFTLHLWSTFEPYRDPPSSLCPWWGENDFPWCYVGCFCVYCERCMIKFLCEHTHIFSLHTFQSTGQWINIVVLVDGVRMLADIIITNSTWINLVLRLILSHEDAITIVDEPKDGLYHDQYLADQFFLVAIKRFLGVCINRPMVFFTVVLTWHGAWRALEAHFFVERVWVALQWVDATCISRLVVIVREGFLGWLYFEVFLPFVIWYVACARGGRARCGVGWAWVASFHHLLIP